MMTNLFRSLAVMGLVLMFIQGFAAVSAFKTAHAELSRKSELASYGVDMEHNLLVFGDIEPATGGTEVPAEN